MKTVTIVLVLILLAAGSLGAYFFLSDSASGGDGQKESAPGPGQLVWSADARTTPIKEADYAPGTWFTDTTVVKAEPDMVTSYELKTGKKSWSFVLDGTLCTASRDVDADRVLIVYVIHGACTGLTAVDIRNGDRLWRLSLIDTVREKADPQLQPGKWDWPLEVAVSNGHGLLTWPTGEQIIRLSDGETVSEEKRKKPCGITRAAGGAQLVSAALCDGTFTVRSLDAEDPDKPKWTWKTQQVFVQSILSTDPTVLVTGENPHQSSRLLVLGDTDGAERMTIDVSDGGKSPECGRLTSRDCTHFLVAGDRIYSAGKGTTTAYDITTGKRAWTYKADSDRPGIPVVVDGDELVTYVAATAERSGKLARVSITSGKAVETIEHDPSLRKAEWKLADSGGAQPYLKGDRFLLVQEDDIDSVKDDVILAIAEQ